MEIHFLTALEAKADMTDTLLGLGHGERLPSGLYTVALSLSSYVAFLVHLPSVLTSLLFLQDFYLVRLEIQQYVLASSYLLRTSLQFL